MHDDPVMEHPKMGLTGIKSRGLSISRCEIYDGSQYCLFWQAILGFQRQKKCVIPAFFQKFNGDSKVFSTLDTPNILYVLKIKNADGTYR